LLQGIFEHPPPSGRIVKSNPNRMLHIHESRNTCCPSGRDNCANLFKLIIWKRDGDLGGSHTKDHIMRRAQSD